MSNSYSQLGIEGVDHLEFAVADLESVSQLYSRLGFEKMAVREIGQRQLRSILIGQGEVRIVLSRSQLTTDPVSQFVSTHGDGIMAIAFRCDNTVTALETTVSRGATLLSAPMKVARDFGQIEKASIRTVGDVQHTFIQRCGSLFD